MGTMLFKTADERIQWLIKINPRGIIQAGFSEWYKSVHGVDSQFKVGQEVIFLWKSKEWIDVMNVTGRVAVITKPEFVVFHSGDEEKAIWG